MGRVKRPGGTGEKKGAQTERLFVLANTVAPQETFSASKWLAPAVMS